MANNDSTPVSKIQWKQLDLLRAGQIEELRKRLDGFARSGGTATLGVDGKIPPSQLPSYDTDDIPEGNNKYYTDERVDERISENVPTLSSDHVTDDSDIGGSTVKNSFDIIYQGLDIDGLTFKSITKGNVESGECKVVDVLNKNENRQCKWLVFVIDQTNETEYSAEILAHHDGSVATYTMYAVLGSASVQFDVNISNNDFRLMCTASADSQSVRVVRTSMKTI